MARVPTRVHDNDRHPIAAALVLVHELDEGDDPSLHKIMVVSDNTKHLAVSDCRKLGFEVSKAWIDCLTPRHPEPARRLRSRSVI